MNSGVLTWSLVLVAGLTLLVKSADFFTSAAERIGLRFGLSSFLIGVTILALGTSLPELAAAVASVLLGASEIAVGTAVGSNVANILLVLGVAGVVAGGLHVAHELVRVDLPFLFGSALLLAILGFDGEIGWFEGLLGLLALSVYLIYATTDRDAPHTTVGAAAIEFARPVAPLTAGTWIAFFASAVLLQLAATFTVVAVTRLSGLAGFGSEILAASIVAVGTSLPELSVTVRSARNGKPELAVGNVIGSNVFNALGVVGASALFGRLAVPPSIVTFALPSMIGATVLCFFVLQEREMTKWDGWLLLVLYVAFTLELYGGW